MIIKDYIKEFAKLSETAQVDILATALNVSNNTSAELIEKIKTELQRQNNLLLYLHQKHSLSEKEADMIQKIKMLRGTVIKQRKEGKIHRLIRTKFYAEIEKLRQDKISWQKIAIYIRINYHCKIPYPSLYRVFLLVKNELENKR